MRRFAPLIALAFLLISGAVGTSYYVRWKQQQRGSGAQHGPLPPGTLATAEDWTWKQDEKGRTIVEVRAKSFQNVGDRFDLTGVELKLAHKEEQDKFDLVKSAKAEFNVKDRTLYSDGEVEITMGVTGGGKAAGRLLRIKSSGVHFESKTGKATTDRPASFQFDQGEGKAVGASYDPSTRELQMRSQVEVVWRGKGPESKPMKIEAGELSYKERDSKVYLSPWSKLTRDTLTLNAASSTVTLKEGVIELVEAQKAQGTEKQPTRMLDYGADQLTLNFDEEGQINHIAGQGNARLVSTAETAQTTTTADRLDLVLDTSNHASTLQLATANGHGSVESKPVARAGGVPAETRVLKSEVIQTHMRAGGHEIDNVETAAPGSLEFLPNAPSQPHRWINGDRMWITYGAQNQIQTFRSVAVCTRTENPKPEGAKEAPPPVLTWSRELQAEFQPKTAQLAKLEQSHDFRYEAGDRKAKAEKAVLNSPENLITLDGAARVWDKTGSTAAQQIVLDQKSGDVTAEGNVASTRLPEKKKEGAEAGLLSSEEPTHARARKMLATDDNLHIRYEGAAVLWQESNRLTADVIEIDREQGSVAAHGNVVSQFLDKQKQDQDSRNKKTRESVLTVVRAPELLYTDENKQAFYQGGVLLDRPGMKVRSQQLRAFLREDDKANSSLEKAFADGQVSIVQAARGRSKTGTSEHAEYYVDRDEVILEGGRPQLVDSVRGTTRGQKLTWFSSDDRLLVNGVETAPAVSKLRRKATTSP